MSHEEGESRTKAVMEFDELLLISQCHSKGHRYPAIKNWFLEKYPAIKNFGMVEVAADSATKITDYLPKTNDKAIA